MVRRWRMPKALSSWKLVSRQDSKSEVQTIIDSQLVQTLLWIVMEQDLVAQEAKKLQFGRKTLDSSTLTSKIKGISNLGVDLVQSRMSMSSTGRLLNQIHTRKESSLAEISSESKENSKKVDIRILSAHLIGFVMSLTACTGPKLKATFDLGN